MMHIYPFLSGSCLVERSPLSHEKGICDWHVMGVRQLDNCWLHCPYSRTTLPIYIC